MTNTMAAGFREFYERFYHGEGPSLTTADELRDVMRAYKAFRRYCGLADALEEAERETLYAARLEYHIGACELAELIGNAARAVQHRQWFLEVWEKWFNELSGESPQPLPPIEAHLPEPREARRGFALRFWEALKDWRARSD